ncbi:MAG: hypothetical protein ABIJ09_06095 [Pseudomonadota bacterium]
MKMLSTLQPRTHPVAALFGMAGVYLVAALILAVFPVGRSVTQEYVFVLCLVTALLAPLAAVAAGGHLIGHDPRVLTESVVAVVLPTAVPPLVTGLVFILLPTCDARTSLILYALGPPASAMLGLALVALLGKVLRSPWLTAVAAVLVVLVSGALTLLRLYREPPTFFFNHFWGAYYGMLYDEVAGVDGRLLQFRVLTWLWALGGLFLARALVPRRDTAPRRAPGWAALCLLTAGALSWSWDDNLHPRRETIERALGKKATTAHFEILVDRRTSDEDLRRLARDHEFRYDQLRQRLGVVPQGTIRSYVYPSAERKAELMGAAGTQLARPWQLEMHINASAFPHPVLAHELVHVLASTMGTGPLRVSSRLGVLIRPGLIEGLAVALEPDVDELPLLDEVRALKSLERLPEIDTLLSLTAFGSEAPARGYVAGGGLFRYLLEVYGMGRVREFYRSGDVETLGDITLEALQQNYGSWLDKQPASAQALALTRRRFERSSLLERRCVHSRRDRYNEIDASLRLGQRQRAVNMLRSLHDDEPDDIETAQRLLGLGQELDEPAWVQEASEWLRAAGNLTAVERQELERIRGDLALRADDEKTACASYRDLILQALNSAQRRNLLVRQLVCDWVGVDDTTVRDAARGVLAYLAGKGPQRAGSRSDLIALAQVREALVASTHPAAQSLRGLISYLIARQLLLPDPARAAALLDESLALPGVELELRVAALEQRAMARYLADDLDGAQEDLALVESLALPPYARQVRDLAERIRFEHGRDVPITIEELGLE